MFLGDMASVKKFDGMVVHPVKIDKSIGTEVREGDTKKAAFCAAVHAA